MPWLFALLAALNLPASQARCAWPHEDCSHTGCCMKKGHSCFKKNAWWATCMRKCKKGIHKEDYGPAKSPWSCEKIDKAHPDCASDHEDCAHLGCCKRAGHRCYRKDAHWASCRPSCERGEVHSSDPPERRTPWECTEISKHEDEDDGEEFAEDGGRSEEEEAEEIAREEEIVEEEEKHHEDLTEGWKGGLQATHFWDCNGGSCDAALLRPWSLKAYKYAPHYAPTDPKKHGGALYGEKLWLTGAASDKLTKLMGPDTDCCGMDAGGGGGCGQCLLVKTYQSNNPHWLAVIMKKNRCPPHSAGCDKVHMDVAVPGFDNLKYSTANVCGESSRSDTYLSKQESAICGSVAPKDCDCSKLPGRTAEQRQLRDGCFLFKKWGWHTGTPKLDYRPVPCPKKFVEWVRVGKAFDESGVMSFADSWNGTAGVSLASDLAAPEAPAAPARCLGGALALAAAAGLAAVAAVAVRWRRRRRGLELLSVEEGQEES